MTEDEKRFDGCLSRFLIAIAFGVLVAFIAL